MTVLVFGASGMIGSEVLAYFQERGISVCAPASGEFTENNLKWRKPSRQKLETRSAHQSNKCVV